jgi:hypothetical protein
MPHFSVTWSITQVLITITIVFPGKVDSMSVPNRIPKFSVQYTKTGKHFVPTVFIPRPSKIYPDRDFWYENIPTYHLATLVPKNSRLKTF